jgi:hypothetical protein
MWLAAMTKDTMPTRRQIIEMRSSAFCQRLDQTLER